MKTELFKNSDSVFQLIITTPIYLRKINDIFIFNEDRLDLLINIHHNRNNRFGTLLKELKDILVYLC